MDFQTRRFAIELKANKTKSIVYKDHIIPIDFYLLKSCSEYFNEYSKKYKKEKTIQLLEDEDFPYQVIIDFINCCQSQEIDINPKNIFYLDYLAKKYRVKQLTQTISEIISENKGKLALDSILFKLNKNFSKIETSEEEDLIAQNFDEYIKNKDESLISLPLSILYRIVQKYYSDKTDENSDLFTNFLFKILDKHGKEASIFTSFFNIKRNRICDLMKLKESYCDKFDVSFLNSSLLKTTVELVQEINDLKDEFTKKLNEMTKISNEQNAIIQSFIKKQEKDKLEIEQKTKEKDSNQSILMNQIKDEIMQLKSKLKKIDVQQIAELNNLERIQYLIPTGKKWNSNDNTNNYISIDDKSITVKCSSHVGDYQIKKVFDGKNEAICPHDVWAPNPNDNNAFIQIEFSSKVSPNFLMITSRNGWVDQAPTHFEIFGIDDHQNQKFSLGEFKYENWKINETKLFPIIKESSFKTYRIDFYKPENKFRALAELNFGKIID